MDRSSNAAAATLYRTAGSVGGWLRFTDPSDGSRSGGNLSSSARRHI